MGLARQCKLHWDTQYQIKGLFCKEISQSGSARTDPM